MKSFMYATMTGALYGAVRPLGSLGHGFIGQSAAEPIDVVTQVGVFGVVIAVAYYFIKRGDTRESKLTSSAQAELKVVRDENAILRAEIHEQQDKTIKALAECLALQTRVRTLETELLTRKGG